MNLTTRASQPFTLKATVLSHGWHECAPMSWCEGGQCFQLIERIEKNVYRISVTEARRSAKYVSLNVLLEGPGIDKAAGQSLLQRVRVSLKLDHQLDAFHEVCRNHDMLRDVPRIGAGRLTHSRSMTENIVKALCATNVNWNQAVKMINRIAQLGPIFPHFRNLNAWPTPREIVKAGEAYLSDICRVGYRADSILSFCDDVASGRNDPERLLALAERRDVPSEEILSELLAINGIGPSSAHFLLTCLGRHDRLSIDSATVYHVQHIHRGGRKPTNKQIERVYEPFGEWRNLVYWFENWITWTTAREMIADPRMNADPRG
jgi:3-methyladenine DNA glycosylase/8-oxoguanine DNA glycosylase